MVSIRDFGKQDRATQTALRRLAIRMVHEGHTRIEAAAAVGVNRHSVGLWVAAVARSGEATLVSGRPGRRADEQKALSLEQEIRIKRLITENCPDQLDMAFALWTREAVALLIERETGVRLSSRTTIVLPRPAMLPNGSSIASPECSRRAAGLSISVQQVMPEILRMRPT